MGRPRRPPAKRVDSDSDVADPSKSVIFLSSSDDEEANKDLSLELVERARERELNRKRAAESEFIALSSASSEDIEMNFDRSAFEDEEEKGKKKKSRGKNKTKKKEGEVAAAAAAEEKVVDDVPKEEEPVGTADSVIAEVNEVPDNAVLRKLLRGPRYFDPGERNSGVCFNCGEEGHAAVNCTIEKRKKPCFVCGMFGHNARRCTQGQDCFICKRRGHIAKNCPDRNKCTPQDSIICLRCGDIGHDMLSCKNDYAPDDLKEIQCYVCKNYGHLCCVDFVDNCPREVSCYNCAQSGHTGLECAKPRGEMTVVASPTLCYKCGEEGHFAQGCTKNAKVPPMPSNGLVPAAPVYVVPHQPRAEPNNKGGAKKASKTTKIVQYAYCGVCNIDCTTQEVLNTHKQGKKNKKNLQKLPEAIKKAAPVADKGDAGSSKRRRRMEAQGADLKTKMMRILGGGAERNQVMVCTICNVIVNSRTVYDSHITGLKHAAMVKKQQEAVAS